MDVLIKFLSDTLGIPYNTAEGGVAVAALFIVVYLLKVLYELIKLLRSADKRDVQQTNLETTLAQLAVRSLNSYDENMKTIQSLETTLAENTQTITKVGNLLEKMSASFGEMTDELKNVVGGIKILTEHSEHAKPILDDIKNNLLKTSKTDIIVMDMDDVIIARFSAEPDGEGNLVVRITERIKQYLSEQPTTDDLTEAAEKAVESIKEEIRG